MERAEQIRGAVKQISFSYRDRTIGPVSVSIGVASFPDHSETIDGLLHAADAALYRAKARRGDCVELAVPYADSPSDQEPPGDREVQFMRHGVSRH